MNGEWTNKLNSRKIHNHISIRHYRMEKILSRRVNPKHNRNRSAISGYILRSIHLSHLEPIIHCWKHEIPSLPAFWTMFLYASSSNYLQMTSWCHTTIFYHLHYLIIKLLMGKWWIAKVNRHIDKIMWRNKWFGICKKPNPFMQSPEDWYGD